MTNRQLAFIIKDQDPLVLAADETVRHACQCMRERYSGSVLVVDTDQHLIGIFTGRDAVRLLAKGKDADLTPLAKAMTRKPVTITPKSRAIDALRAMAEGGFRHVPVIEEGALKGVVSRGDLKGMELEEFARRRAGMRSGAKATFRTLSDILHGRKPLVAAQDQTVHQACRKMWARKIGCTLIVDKDHCLSGIFTGRDAVRVLAAAQEAAATKLEDAMTPSPVTLTLGSSAIDALRAMDDGGFRHLPVIDNGKIYGVVSRGDFSGIEIDRLDEEQHLKEVLW